MRGLVLAVLVATPFRGVAAQDPIRVVATLPIYAEIVEAIGGDQVAVSSIADPAEDAHFVRPKPSFALDIRRADVFITTGLDLELWVPALLDRAGNARVSEGGRGYITTYGGIELLDVPSAADRSAGDIHLYGNPHLFTDPLNVAQIARNINAGLKRVAPDRAQQFDAGLASFIDRIDRHLFGDDLVDLLGGETLEQLAKQGRLFDFLESQQYQDHPLMTRLGGWLAQGQAFRGKQMICYHKNWAYFENRFGVECADYIEAKPGIPPTPGHVAQLIERMRNESIHVLFAANYFDRGKVETVGRRAGATVVMVPMEPRGAPGVDDYFDVVDTWVSSLARAFSQGS
jgi:zinc/manganese transport system substrate-binding protein